MAFAALGALLLALEAATTFGWLGHGENAQAASTWLYYALMGGSAAIVLWRAVRRPEARLAWSLIGCGVAAWLAGDVAYEILQSAPGRLPFPSISDALYLSQYVFLLAGLRAMGARLRGGGTETLSLAVALLGLATIWSWLVFGEVISSASGDMAAVAVTAAYPLLDLALLGSALLALAARDWRLDAAFAALLAAFGVLAVGDMIYTAQVTLGTYTDEGLVTLTWPLSASLVALAAWLPSDATGRGINGARFVPLLTTVTAALAALVLSWDHFVRVDTTTVMLAIATLAAAIAQMANLFLRHAAAKQRVLASEALRSASTEAAIDCVVSFDGEGIVHEWNEAACRTFGIDRERAMGLQVGDLLQPAIPADTISRLAATIGLRSAEGLNERAELTAVHARGGTFPIEAAITRVQENPPMFAAYARDITQRRRRQEENERLAAIVRSSADAILSKDLAGTVTAWNRGAEALYGYTPAEAIGQPIWELIIPEARRGEYERIVGGVLERGSAQFETKRHTKEGAVVDVSLRAFPIRSLDGRVVGISTSAHDLTEKRRRERHDDREQGRLMWRERIRHALDEDRLRFWGQPVVDAKSGRVHHHELLLRMELDGKIVIPNLFLPHAEQTELITEIDRWAMSRGCELARRSPVAINLSAKSLSNPRLPDLIAQSIEEAGASPSDIVFEITETAAAENLDSARALVERLSRLGCGVALDDFGTGYGSFTYLKYLSVTQLKIDITFIRNLVRDDVDRRVVTSIVAVAENFGMQTVAEGVEDEPTRDLLEEMGVTLLQGFHLGLPMPMEMAGLRDGLTASNDSGSRHPELAKVTANA